MSMVGCYASIAPQKLEELRADPESISEYLYPDDDRDAEEGPLYIDIDKAWHGIHFLLTGRADLGNEPLSLAVFGGEEFGPDAGYGPARFLTPEQVRSVANELQRLPSSELAKRFAPKQMDAADIYPNIWERDGEEGLSYLLQNYEQLQTFFCDTAARGDAALLWLS